MITDVAEIENLIDEIAAEEDEPLNMFLIGGGAMMYMGCKYNTKDMDLVVRSTNDFRSLSNTLEKLGFVPTRPGAGYSRMNLSEMFVRDRDGVRIDLFENSVCGRLRLSDGMAERSKIRYTSDKITLRTCSEEDVLIFKSITERPDDRKDGVAIITVHKIDWNTVLDEILKQVSEGEDVWITWIASGLTEISEMTGYRIPILKKVDELADDYLEKWANDLTNKQKRA